MSAPHNPGRVAGLWYLLLTAIGPLRLIYIPRRLFVDGNATATAGNIAAHEWLFRFGIVGDLAGAVILVLLALAFYRLFRGVDPYLAVLVVIFGGVMPAVIYFVNAVSDSAALMVVRGEDFLTVFEKPQRDGHRWPVAKPNGELGSCRIRELESHQPPTRQLTNSPIVVWVRRPWSRAGARRRY